MKIGVGTGKNLPCYRPGVKVSAIDFSRRMPTRARKMASQNNQKVDFLNTVLHFEMGIDGTVFIRQPDGSTGLVWTNGPAFEKENIWHLHTFISSWHSDDGGMVSGLGTVRHCPDYFMIDGCDGNDTLTNPAFAQCAEKNHLKKNRQSQNGSAFII